MILISSKQDVRIPVIPVFGVRCLLIDSADGRHEIMYVLCKAGTAARMMRTRWLSLYFKKEGDY